MLDTGNTTSTARRPTTAAHQVLGSVDLLSRAALDSHPPTAIPADQLDKITLGGFLAWHRGGGSISLSASDLLVIGGRNFARLTDALVSVENEF